MKKNPTKPSTDLVLGGRTYHLLLESVALAEDLSGRALLTGLRRQDYQTPTLNLVRTMLFACLNPNHPELTFDEVKAMVKRDNIPEIWTPILSAWFASLAEPDPEEEGQENPIQAEPSVTQNIG